MKRQNIKFLNFPISLLQGFMEDSKQALGKIIDYCIIYEMKVHQKQLDELLADYKMMRPSDLWGWLEGSTKIFNETPRNQPRTGMEVRVFWEFYQEKKTDEEKAILLAFLAVKSILGVNLWYKLGKQEIIFHRMAGQADCKEEIPDTIKPFTTRHKFDKIKAALQLHWGMVIYANHTRGMFISTELSLEELAFRVEKMKMATKLKQDRLKTQQEEARNKALFRLWENRT